MHEEITKAIQLLNQNKLVVIPTETVYGLAGNAFSEEAIQKIYALKKRPASNPLIVHIKDWSYVERIAEDIPEKAKVLAQHFWPGPLTLILKRKEIIPAIASAGMPTVAVRIPDHELTLDLLSKLDFPLVAPSANPFTSISPTSAEHVQTYFREDPPFILDGGPCFRGIESTIVGFEGEQPVVYRLGSISIEEIEKVAGTVKTRNESSSKPIAPGMLKKHYSPKTPFIFTKDPHRMIEMNHGKRIGLLLFQCKIVGYPIDAQHILSPSGDMREAAKNVYAAMHQLDGLNLDVIIAEHLPNNGIGQSINDRLERASN